MQPLVTIACACGGLGEVPLGGRLECACGAVFLAVPGTPAHRSAAVAVRRRHRLLLATSLLALLVLLATPLVALDRSAALFVPVAALALWFGSVRPYLADRSRRALASLPEWVVAS